MGGVHAYLETAGRRVDQFVWSQATWTTTCMRLPTSLEGAGGVGGVHAFLETAGRQVDKFAFDIASLAVIQCTCLWIAAFLRRG